MTRLHIPAIVDLLLVDDAATISAVADDRRLDRAYAPNGPLINRIVTSRIRKDLQLAGVPFPPVAPRGAQRPVPAQAALEARLDPLAPQLAQGGPSLKTLADYVRGVGADDDAGPLSQQAVGRLFDPAYEADAASWAAAKTLDAAPRSFNPFQLIWWALTGAVPKARALLAAKVGGDPSGTHGTGVAVHNIVAGFQQMRRLWADERARTQLSPEAAAAQCLVAPQQVVRQPTAAGMSAAGEFAATTLVMLQLNRAHAADPNAETAFMAASWARCPAHAWVPALLAGAWRAAQSEG
ncbi:MAG TPA: hypothetical protein VMT68_19340 [Caulobacteraceae bacterium]|nr:hypothetical protein [Caulobacteraceae bacterium]